MSLFPDPSYKQLTRLLEQEGCWVIADGLVTITSRFLHSRTVVREEENLDRDGQASV